MRHFHVVAGTVACLLAASLGLWFLFGVFSSASHDARLLVETGGAWWLLAFPAYWLGIWLVSWFTD